MNPKQSNFVNGLPEMLILRLVSVEEMYGYQLVAAIRERSGDTFTFGEGCIYPILHKLVGLRCLTSRRQVVDGRPRHYYKTSAKGRKRLDGLSAEWKETVSGAHAIMEAQYV